MQKKRIKTTGYELRSKITNCNKGKLERERNSVQTVQLVCNAGAFQLLDLQRREVGSLFAAKTIRILSLEQRPVNADHERPATTRRSDGRTATANDVTGPMILFYHCLIVLLVTRTVSPKTKGLKCKGPMTKAGNYVRPNIEFMPITILVIGDPKIINRHILRIL